MPNPQHPEASEFKLESIDDFESHVAEIAKLQARERDDIAEIKLAGMIAAADDFIRQHSRRDSEGLTDRSIHRRPRINAAGQRQSGI